MQDATDRLTLQSQLEEVAAGKKNNRMRMAPGSHLFFFLLLLHFLIFTVFAAIEVVVMNVSAYRRAVEPD